MANDDIAPSQEFFLRSSGTGSGGWEISRPQPVITQLVGQGIFQGEILDIGCGLGDNAIYIANHAKNIHLTAIDLVPRAIEVVREKAQEAKVDIRFEVINILDDLSKTNILKQHSYDIILDSAIFHIFSDEDRLRYMKNLEYLIKPGGLYIQLCFSEKETRTGGPRRIKKSDLDELFSVTNGWTLESIEDTLYESRSETTLGADGRAYLSFIRRHNNV